MADIPADFFSSDVVLGEDENENTSKYAGLGKRSIDSMTASAFDDRLRSKKAVKQDWQIGAPTTIVSSYFWANLFYHFFEVTLQKSKTASTPTTDDVARFLDTAVTHIRGRYPGGVVSYDYISYGAKKLLERLHLDYPGFRIDRHGALRIKNTLNGMLHQGRITKDPIRVKKWLTTRILARLVSALLTDAVRDPTWSWDKVVQKCLGLVLQVATATRIGDLALSRGYHDGDQFMRFEHITIKLVTLSTTSRGENKLLVMQVQLVYAKGFKDNKKRARMVRVDALPSEQAQYMCPVNLLLVHAIRTGALATARTYEEVLQSCMADPEGTLRWTQPKWPIFMQFEGTGGRHGLLKGKPAPASQLGETVKKAALLAGLTGDVVSHDVRRGALRDISRVGKTMDKSGIANSTIAHFAGHSNRTLKAGITQGYIGPRGSAVYHEIVAGITDEEADARANAFVQLSGSTTPFKPKRHSSKDVSAFIVAAGKDPDCKKTRDWASRQLTKADEEEWRKTCEISTNGWVPPSHFIPERTTDTVKITEVASSSESDGITGEMDPTGVEVAILSGSFDNLDNRVLDSVLEGDLQESTSTKPSAADGHDKDLPHLNRTRAEFIDTFAATDGMLKDRVSLRKTPKEERPKLGEPLKCPNVHCGGRLFSSRDHLRRHMRLCKPIDPAKARRCPNDDCSATFETEESLIRHIQMAHFPKDRRTCSICGEVFKTVRELMDHQWDKHSNFQPMQCPEQGCEQSQDLWSSLLSLKAHLKTAHGMDTATQNERISAHHQGPIVTMINGYPQTFKSRPVKKGQYNFSSR